MKYPHVISFVKFYENYLMAVCECDECGRLFLVNLEYEEVLDEGWECECGAYYYNVIIIAREMCNRIDKMCNQISGIAEKINKNIKRYVR